MVYVQMGGDMFRIDLSAPAAPAARWSRGGWSVDERSNEQVLFHPRTEGVANFVEDVLVALSRFGGAAA